MILARRFSDVTRRYQVVLTSPALEGLLERGIADWPRETGGVLIGQYNAEHDTATVLQIERPPDSVGRHTTFRRGRQGLGTLLQQLWQEPQQRFYLGEWHTHPRKSPEPSPTDLSQMREPALRRGFSCPEPVLVILGGDPQSNWSLHVSVHPRGVAPITLIEESQ